MSEETDLRYTYWKLNCDKCGKQILVEMIHEDQLKPMTVIATCGQCLIEEGLNEEFIEEHPEIIEDMNVWLGLKVETES